MAEQANAVPPLTLTEDPTSPTAVPAVAEAANAAAAHPISASDVVRMIGYFANEFKGFMAHVEQTVQRFSETGELPNQPLYKVTYTGRAKGEPGRPKKVRRDKIVRKPTPFNHYVAEKIKELKQQGVTFEDDKNNNELFKRAVSEWGLLTKEQKHEYGVRYRAAHPDAVHNPEGEDQDVDVDVEDQQMEDHAQLLLDGAAGAAAAAAGPSTGAADASGKRKAAGDVAAAGQLPGQLLPPGVDPDGEQISLTALVTGGEDGNLAQAEAPVAEEQGRKKRKAATQGRK